MFIEIGRKLAVQGGEKPWNCTGPSPMRSDITVVQETAARGARSADFDLVDEGVSIKVLSSLGCGERRSPAKAGAQRHGRTDWAPAFAGERADERGRAR
jgi:hypothetical protein